MTTRSISRNAGIFALLLAFALTAGCGGGGGGSKSAAKKISAKNRVIITARVMRNIFAVTGLGGLITRAAQPRTGGRINLILAALKHTRDVQQGLDKETGLYYTLTVNADGSGQELLFTDSARTKPAGSFTWPIPQWNNGKPDSYPAILTVTYAITAGEFAGTNGMMTITLKDASGTKNVIHLILHDAFKENCEGDYQSTDGVLDALATISLPDGSTYQEKDDTQPDGSMICTFLFSDGDKEIMEMSADGTTTETFTNSNGIMEATGDLSSDGTDTIQLPDGSSDTVDVDTQDTYDNSSSDSSGSDNSGSEDSNAVRRRSAKNALQAPRVLPHP